jgi:hypothetical protein
LVDGALHPNPNPNPVRFLDFEILTCAPIQTKLVDAALLAPAELGFLNYYNTWVRSKVRQALPLALHGCCPPYV